MSAAGAALTGRSALAEPVKTLPQALRARFLELMKAGSVPAAGIAVVKDGQPVLIDALGIASLPFSVPANTHTLFHLASVSKQFTAATVVALAREGRFSLADPLGNHLPGLPAHMARVPITSLLSHSSGLADYMSIEGFDGSRRIDRETFLREVAKLPVEFEPGEAFHYSNTGYVLLGHLIAATSGKTYHAEVERRLLAPAGLRQSRFDDATGIIPNRAEPYIMEDGTIRHAPPMEGEYSRWPDGGLLMSPEDAGRWEAGLQRGQPVLAADYRQMTTPCVLSTGRSCGYGFAMGVDKWHGRDIHHHTGSVAGFLAYHLRIPALGLGVMTMVNSDSEPASDVRRRLAEEALEAIAPGSTALSLNEIKDSKPELTREMLRMVTKGAKLDARRFAPEIAVLLRKGYADAGPTQFEDGAPDRLLLIEAFAEGNCSVRRYRAEFAERAVHFSVGYDPDGLIFRIL